MSSLVRGRVSLPLDQLAMSVERSQRLEIGEMKGWLMVWNKPSMPPSAKMDWVVWRSDDLDVFDPQLLSYLDACRSQRGMPGLVSMAELDELRRQSGAKLDVLFMQLMIRHHASAVAMARYAAVRADTTLVRTIATSIAREQQLEIQQMARLLIAAGQGPLGQLMRPPVAAGSVAPSTAP